MKIFLVILILVAWIILSLWVVALVLTWSSRVSPNQKRFIHGVVGEVPPSGFYHGTASVTASWQGKKFALGKHVAGTSPFKQSGINVFKNGDAYPFSTDTGPGLVDPGIQVIKIDYNNASNPFWIRPILDEIVQIAPGQYLGKINVRWIPGLPFTIGYFELQQAEK